jgi:hypothetical protein
MNLDPSIYSALLGTSGTLPSREPTGLSRPSQGVVTAPWRRSCAIRHPGFTEKTCPHR